MIIKFSVYIYIYIGSHACTVCKINKCLTGSCTQNFVNTKAALMRGPCFGPFLINLYVS